MDFYDVLASLIHDMKNSLSMVTSTLEEITADPSFHYDKIERVTALKNEASRLNNNLIELLTLYKIENERVSATIDDVDVDYFLQELVTEHNASAEANGIHLYYECDPDLFGYFDESLIRGVLNNLIGNGIRYTLDQLLVSAEQEGEYLVFRVEDNGQGYPQKMLRAQSADGEHDELLEGRTKLGLHFASMIAGMHTNRDRQGYIQLQNKHKLEGGCFSIWLP